MNVMVGTPENAERLGIASVLVATEDLYVAEYLLEPGREPGDLHYHAEHTDSFYVIEGELEFQTAEGPVRISAGSILVAPRDAIHAFPVAVGGQARFLNLHTPGGFERYMRELVAIRSKGEKPDADFLKKHDQYPV